MPTLVATWSFGLAAGRAAWPALVGGGDSLDAVETACRHAEDDPAVDSVGYGGLPDRTGVMSFDGCVMLAPDRCGAVCAMQHGRHPVTVARRVMERSEHVMLAGAGADAFARAEGIPPEPTLSPEARAAWESWKERPIPIDQSRDRGLRPIDRGPEADGRLFADDEDAPHDDESRWKFHDTIGALALDDAGVLAGACSTSGTPYKAPGRVGDSPIIGHGLYVDPGVGAATATGSGELVMGVCGAFLVVELLRQGVDPPSAMLQVLARIERSHRLEPHHQVAFLVLRADGAFASAALRSGYRTAVLTTSRQEVVEPDAVLLPELRRP